MNCNCQAQDDFGITMPCTFHVKWLESAITPLKVEIKRLTGIADRANQAMEKHQKHAWALEIAIQEAHRDADAANLKVAEAMKACPWATHAANHTEPKHCIAALASLLEMRENEKPISIARVPCVDDEHRGTECRCGHIIAHCCSHHCCCFYRCKDCRHAWDAHAHTDSSQCEFSACGCQKYRGEIP